jgi:hypothetical protein
MKVKPAFSREKMAGLCISDCPAASGYLRLGLRETPCFQVTIFVKI